MKDGRVMQNRMWPAAVGLLVLGMPAAAAAQVVDWEDRAFININAGGQTQSRTIEAASVFPLYGEEASLQSSIESGKGMLFDISGGARVWGNLGFGVGFSRFSDTSSTTVRGSLPHPLFFNQHRQVTASVSGLEHTESAVHLFALWMLPLSEKIDVALFAGPSFFDVSQDLVAAAVPTSEVPPFAAPVISATKIGADETAVGANVGVDVSYMVTSRVGAGLFLRYAQASVTFEGGGQSANTDVGGFQVGAGLRVRFK